MEPAHKLPEIQAPQFQRVDEILEQGVRDAVFPGAVLLVGVNGQIAYQRAVGFRSLGVSEDGEGPLPMKKETVFDIASLTSSIVTTTLLMRLVDEQKVSLDDRVARYLQGFGVFNKSAITVGQILSHSAGLVHWHPFFEDLLRENATVRMGILTSRGAREYISNAINRSQLKYQPGTRQVYSDIGMILAGELVETLTGQSLDKAAHRYVFAPLGMKSTSFIDLSMIRRRGIHPVTNLIAPTEACPWRKRVLCGEVHDDNAWSMGGIAGHAGLFTTANDLHLISRALLASYHARGNFLTRKTVSTFFGGPASPERAAWKFGWDSPSKDNGMLDSGLSPSAVGQCGFTGCSLWLEPERVINVVLMTNRVHPSRSNKKVIAYRPMLHKAILDAIVE